MVRRRRGLGALLGPQRLLSRHRRGPWAPRCAQGAGLGVGFDVFCFEANLEAVGAGGSFRIFSGQSPSGREGTCPRRFPGTASGANPCSHFCPPAPPAPGRRARSTTRTLPGAVEGRRLLVPQPRVASRPGHGHGHALSQSHGLPCLGPLLLRGSEGGNKWGLCLGGCVFI